MRRPRNMGQTRCPVPPRPRHHFSWSLFLPFVCTAMVSLGGKAEKVKVNSLKSMVHVSSTASQSSWPFESKADTKADPLISPQTSHDSGYKGNVSFDADETGTRLQGRTLSVGM